MKIIHKYITTSYLAVFLGALFAITFVLSLGGIFKVIDLIAKGYGAISWGFFVVFIIPLLTLGVYKILNKRAWPL